MQTRKRIDVVGIVINVLMAICAVFVISTAVMIKTDHLDLYYQAWAICTKPIDLEESYSNLPESAQAIVADYDFIISDSADLSSEIDDVASTGSEFSVTEGYIDYNSKEIHLSRNGEWAKEAYVHEVGHAVDAANGFPSHSEEFIIIFENEAKAGTYGATSEGEFFAEVYKSLVEGNADADMPEANAFVSQFL